jgi:asparagine synthase (glutamine-hydrolysing)
MCGLLGSVTKDYISDDVLKQSLELLHHRGPDNINFKKIDFEKYYVKFGHTRLSIIDMSNISIQPFVSICGNYSLIYNGEIYNFKELKSELIEYGYIFKSNSDTEVLLNTLIQWGSSCLNRLIGMFSFAFLDKKKNSILFARDAFGIKPFFYSYSNKEIFFSSEIKSLINLKQKPITPNLQTSYDYLINKELDSKDQTFISEINQLKPAHFFSFDLKSGKLSSQVKWWDPNISTNLDITFDEASKKIRELFLESIKLHLRSDVPVGIALSGGIDSSSIASAIKSINPKFKLKTFSYVTNDKNISEEKWIDIINKDLNAESHKIEIKDNELFEDLNDLIEKQGEPFNGPSVYAQYRLFKLVKKEKIKVILDGQGADEIFAGYYGYPGQRILSLIETDGMLSAHKFAKNWASQLNKNYFIAWQYFLKLKFSDFVYRIIRKFMGRSSKPDWLNLKFLKQKISFRENRPILSPDNKGQRVKEALIHSYKSRGLRALLRYADRNSMASSIESRVPFLSLKLVNYVLSLPESYLISEKGLSKNIFRKAMRGIVHDNILDRKDKLGFDTPESAWMLNNSIQIKTFIKKAKIPVFFDKEKLFQTFNEVLNKKKKYNSQVWRLFNYIKWYNSYF